MIDVLLWVIALGYFGSCWLAGRFAPTLVGALVVLVWVVASVFVIVVNGFEVRSLVMAAIGVVLAAISVGVGRDTRRRRLPAR
jgi:hypothetical protein